MHCPAIRANEYSAVFPRAIRRVLDIILCSQLRCVRLAKTTATAYEMPEWESNGSHLKRVKQRGPSDLSVSTFHTCIVYISRGPHCSALFHLFLYRIFSQLSSSLALWSFWTVRLSPPLSLFYYSVHCPASVQLSQISITPALIRSVEAWYLGLCRGSEFSSPSVDFSLPMQWFQVLSPSIVWSSIYQRLLLASFWCSCLIRLF